MEGKKHDYGSFKGEFPTGQSGKPPQDRKLRMDTGYTGIKKDYPQLNVMTLRFQRNLMAL